MRTTAKIGFVGPLLATDIAIVETVAIDDKGDAILDDKGDAILYLTFCHTLDTAHVGHGPIGANAGTAPFDPMTGAPRARTSAAAGDIALRRRSSGRLRVPPGPLAGRPERETIGVSVRLTIVVPITPSARQGKAPRNTSPPLVKPPPTRPAGREACAPIRARQTTGHPGRGHATHGSAAQWKID